MSKLLQLITLINLSNSILALIPICPNPTYQSLLPKSSSFSQSYNSNNRNQQHFLHMARPNFTPREPRPILVKKASITTTTSSSSSSSFKSNPKSTLNKSSISTNNKAVTTSTNTYKPIPTVNRNARFSTQTSSSSTTNTLDQSSPPQLERLQKVMSQAGITSRRNAEKLILDGRVTVNGKMVNEVGTKINPKIDILTVDGKKIFLDTSFGDQKKIFWIVIHKPRNYLTTTADNEKSQVEKEEKRETVLDLIPQAKELRLLPIGRLERDTTGVLILTNENNWIHPLTHPSYKLVKKYEIIVEGIPSEAVLDTIRKDFVSGIDNSLIKGSEVLLTDTDKRNNLACLEIQFEDSNTAKIQKMMEFIKHPIVSIKRTNFGPIELKGLKKGQWRELTSNDVEKLKLACTKAPEEETEEIKKILKRNARFNRRLSFNNNNNKDGDNSYVNNRFSSSSSSLRKAGAGYYSRTIGRGFSGYTAAPAILSSGNDGSGSMSGSSGGVGKGRGKRGRSFTKTASNGYSSSGGGGGSSAFSSRRSDSSRPSTMGGATASRAATTATTSAWASSSSRRMQSQSSTAASTAPLRRSSTTPKIYKPSR